MNTRNADFDIREASAKNPNTSAETLALLAKDEDWQVRAAVAWNPNTSAGGDEILPSQAGN